VGGASRTGRDGSDGSGGIAPDPSKGGQSGKEVNGRCGNNGSGERSIVLNLPQS